jgi:hypothetical protein
MRSWSLMRIVRLIHVPLRSSSVLWMIGLHANFAPASAKTFELRLLPLDLDGVSHLSESPMNRGLQPGDQIALVVAGTTNPKCRPEDVTPTLFDINGPKKMRITQRRGGFFPNALSEIVCHLVIPTGNCSDRLTITDKVPSGRAKGPMSCRRAWKKGALSLRRVQVCE